MLRIWFVLLFLSMAVTCLSADAQGIDQTHPKFEGFYTDLGLGYKKRYEDGAHPQEDWNLWDKMLQQGATVASLKEGLLFYRRHRENFLKYSHETSRLKALEVN